MTKRIDLRSRTLHALAVLGVAALAVSAGVASADEDLGRGLYLRYCSACHGEGAKGDGVVSQLMRPKPPDLTQLASKAKGKFPFYDVVRQIDGRETIRAHGGSTMPVWGVVFRSEEGESTGAEAVVRGKVVLITDYLERIQQK
jgi:mono/diheme cytochrome c family protein